MNERVIPVVPSSRGLPSLKRTCLIKPKMTGVASLVVQFGILIVSGITAMFYFYHIGGYEYMMWNENSTILEPVHHPHQFDTTIKPIINTPEPEPTTSFPSGITLTDQFADDSIAKSLLSADGFDALYNDTSELPKLEEEEQKSKNNASDSLSTELVEYFETLLVTEKEVTNDTFGIEQVPLTMIDILGSEFDLLEIIRISTLVYLCCCTVWFVTLSFLFLSIKCEIVDLVIINTTILFIVVVYVLAHVGLIGSLLYFQREMSWRTSAITIGTIVILSCCNILGVVSVILNYGWIGYITFMHNDIRCQCMAMLVSLIKGNHRQAAATTMDYQLPVTVRPAEVRYNDDGPIQEFSAF